VPDQDRFLVSGPVELRRLRGRVRLEHPDLFTRRARAQVRLSKTPTRVQAYLWGRTDREGFLRRVMVAAVGEASPDETPLTFDLRGIFVMERDGHLMVRVRPWSRFRRGPLKGKRLPSFVIHVLKQDPDAPTPARGSWVMVAGRLVRGRLVGSITFVRPRRGRALPPPPEG